MLLFLLALVALALARDSFHAPPDGWQNRRPGDILRWRAIEPQFLQRDVHVHAAYQLLYRTSDVDPNQPSYTTTTVLVPRNAAHDKLVLGSAAQDSNADQCTPSAGYTYNNNANVLFMIDEYNFLPFLNEGYILSVPDKDGPRNTFAAGPLEGHMLLDAARATLNFDKLGLANHTRIAGTGYSGGALTASWAAALHPSYAPELDIAAWAFGGTPASVETTMNTLNDSPFSGLFVPAIRGVMDAFPDAKHEIVPHLTTFARDAFELALHICAPDAILRFPFQDFYSSKYQSKGKHIFDGPAVQHLFKKLDLAQRPDLIPKAPIFMYHARHDEIVPYNSAHKTAKMWCEHGADVHFETLSHIEHGHVTTMITGGMPSFHYIRDTFNGKASSGCRFSTKGSLFFDPRVLGDSAGNILDGILATFGKVLGPKAGVLKKWRADVH